MRIAIADYDPPHLAARIAGLTVPGLKLHDEYLKPIRLAGGQRLYLRARVEHFARERAAKRGG